MIWLVFIGTIPEELCEILDLQVLNLESNNLTGRKSLVFILMIFSSFSRSNYVFYQFCRRASTCHHQDENARRERSPQRQHWIHITRQHEWVRRRWTIRPIFLLAERFFSYSSSKRSVRPLFWHNVRPLFWHSYFCPCCIGTIPVELAQLSNLQYLTLDGNQLTGLKSTNFGNANFCSFIRMKMSLPRLL